MATKPDLMDQLRWEIATHLGQIEATCHAYGLTALTRFTFIARDPHNGHMTLVLSNDDLATACHVAHTSTQEVADGDLD